MFNSPLIDIALSLVLLYLILSLVVTAVNDLIFTFTRFRAKHLERGIRNLFFDEHWKTLVEEVLKNPHISILRKKAGKFPSTIQSNNFANALLTTISEDISDLKIIRQALDEKTGKHGELYKMLNTFLLQATDINDFTKKVEEMYDDAMERVLGWFKRRAKINSYIISFILTIALNADTIDITSYLWKNKEAREKLAAISVGVADSVEYDTANSTFMLNWKGEAYTFNMMQDTAKNDTVTGEEFMEIADKFAVAQNTAKILTEIGFPLGWSRWETQPPCCIKSKIAGEKSKALKIWFVFWFTHLIGWLITTAAIAFGAPFWFDLLKKISPLKKK